MPLVAHNDLPAFRRLQENGHPVIPLERAVRQDIRELHLGFLNMMPDAALAATEQQFIRLVGSCNQIAQFYVYPFSLPELNRGADATEHIDAHYFDFEALAAEGLDALIVTGANVSNPSLDEEPFWDPLMKVLSWAEDNVASVLCSCLASHALLKHQHGIERQPLPQKKWGVYSHRIRQSAHPLMRDINTRFDVPHSRYNEVTATAIENAGLTVLADSDDAGVHIAVSPDRFRVVYFQGHPEYDAISLLKEYKREVNRFLNGELDAPPPLPENYFREDPTHITDRYLETAQIAQSIGEPLPAFPDDELAVLVDNTWGDTGKAVVNNWLGLVYRLTNLDRRKQFMPDVDPDDPIGLRG